MVVPTQHCVKTTVSGARESNHGSSEATLLLRISVFLSVTCSDKHLIGLSTTETPGKPIDGVGT